MRGLVHAPCPMRREMEASLKHGVGRAVKPEIGRGPRVCGLGRRKRRRPRNPQTGSAESTFWIHGGRHPCISAARRVILLPDKRGLMQRLCSPRVWLGIVVIAPLPMARIIASARAASGMASAADTFVASLTPE